jgi:membrane peptidoglycan carboxypeptidase
MADAHFPPPRLPAPLGHAAKLLGTRFGSIIVVGLALALLMALLSLPVVIPAGALARDTAKRLGDIPPLPRVGPLAQRTTIYAANGSRLGFLADENRVVVPISQIPKVVRDAVVAIEDDRFYEHKGIDLRGIARAAVEDLRSGKIEQGGSTLTQQYVKLIVINDTSQTLDRKIREAAYAVQLEKQLTKDQILEAYLNAAYFGEGAYGIATAAQHYFNGKPLSKLTLTEAASLAATIKSPEVYKPTRPKANLPRLQIVLDRMQQLGFASPAAVTKAKKAKLHVKVVTTKVQRPYFFEYVRLQLLNDPAYDKVLGKAGSPQRAKAVRQGGLKVYTTLEPARQQQAESAVRQQLLAPSRRTSGAGKDGQLSGAGIDGALASLDPKTGQIVAMVSGRDYKKSQVNLATISNASIGWAGGHGFQSGSSFKMFFDVAAQEQGIPVSKTFDAKTTYTSQNPRCKNSDGTQWEPHNAGDGEAGTFNMYGATQHSVNTWFAQLVDKDVAPQQGADVAHRMGITNVGDQRYGNWNVCSLVLGTASVGVLDMASAFGTLANQGVHCTPFSIARIVGPNGKTLVSRKPNCSQVIDRGIANQTVDILRTVVTGGTGTAAAVPGHPVAGKTGTTNDNASAFFNGFTPQLATSVWVGFHTPTPMPGLSPSGGGVFGGTYPAMIFRQYMEAALLGQPVENFPAPPHPRPKPPDQNQGKGVPNVKGKMLAQAVAILSKAGYGVSIQQVANRAPVGRVVGQSPRAGTDAPKGTVVTLQVSIGRSGGGGGGGGGGPGPPPTFP